MQTFKQFINTESKNESPNTKKSRVSFYMDYYKNLSPNKFIITKVKDTISIKIKN